MSSSRSPGSRRSLRQISSSFAPARRRAVVRVVEVGARVDHASGRAAAGRSRWRRRSGGGRPAGRARASAGRADRRLDRRHGRAARIARAADPDRGRGHPEAVGGRQLKALERLAGVEHVLGVVGDGQRAVDPGSGQAQLVGAVSRCEIARPWRTSTTGGPPGSVLPSRTATSPGAAQAGHPQSRSACAVPRQRPAGGRSGDGWADGRGRPASGGRCSRSVLQPSRHAQIYIRIHAPLVVPWPLPDRRWR